MGQRQQVDVSDYGWSWSYSAQQKELPETISGFTQWRENILTETRNTVVRKPYNGNLLTQIADFDLAGHTPMQAMNAIALWQQCIV